jgi:hypothetical protein
MSTVNNVKIDTQKLVPLLKSIGWSLAQAERDLKADLSRPVSSELKNHLWQTIQIAKRFKVFYPQTKVTGMRYVNPGSGSGGGG